MALTLRSQTTYDLTVEELDANFTYLDDRITGIADDIPNPPYPSNITQSGFTLSFYLSDASLLGTATIPVAGVSYRDEWQPTTNYFVNDLVKVRGVGFFLVTANHTSAASFPGAGATYVFQYADQTVQLPLIVSTTTLTMTRALHLNRLLLFTNVSGCAVTLDPDDWQDGDPVHAMNRSGMPVTFSGTSDLDFDPEDGKAASMSNRGSAASMIYLADEGVMSMIGGLDAVSA